MTSKRCGRSIHEVGSPCPSPRGTDATSAHSCRPRRMPSGISRHVRALRSCFRGACEPRKGCLNPLLGNRQTRKDRPGEEIWVGSQYSKRLSRTATLPVSWLRGKSNSATVTTVLSSEHVWAVAAPRCARCRAAGISSSRRIGQKRLWFRLISATPCSEGNHGRLRRVRRFGTSGIGFLRSAFSWISGPDTRVARASTRCCSRWPVARYLTAQPLP